MHDGTDLNRLHEFSCPCSSERSLTRLRACVQALRSLGVNYRVINILGAFTDEDLRDEERDSLLEAFYTLMEVRFPWLAQEHSNFGQHIPLSKDEETKMMRDELANRHLVIPCTCRLPHTPLEAFHTLTQVSSLSFINLSLIPSAPLSLSVTQTHTGSDTHAHIVISEQTEM